MHFTSNNHLESVKFQNEIRENRPVTPYYCEICSKYANSLDTLAVHLGSKSHKTKLFNKEAIESVDCKSLPFKKTFTVENFKNIFDFNNNPNINLFNLAKLDSPPKENRLISVKNESNNKNKKNNQTEAKPTSQMCRSSTFQFDALSENNVIKPIGLIKSSPNNAASLSSWKQPMCEENEDENEAPSGGFNWCHCCYLKYTSPSEKEKHLSGKEHFKRVDIKNRLANSQLSPNDYCEFCCSRINDESQRAAHLNSPAHHLQVNRYKEYLIAVQNLRNFTVNSIKSSETPRSCSTEAVAKNNKQVYAETTQKTAENKDSLNQDLFQELVVFSEIFIKAGVKIYDYNMRNGRGLSPHFDQNDEQVNQIGVKSVEDFQINLQSIFNSITSIKYDN
jgi:hypothetical protein